MGRVVDQTKPLWEFERGEIIRNVLNAGHIRIEEARRIPPDLVPDETIYLEVDSEEEYTLAKFEEVITEDDQSNKPRAGILFRSYDGQSEMFDGVVVLGEGFGHPGSYKLLENMIEEC